MKPRGRDFLPSGPRSADRSSSPRMSGGTAEKATLREQFRKQWRPRRLRNEAIRLMGIDPADLGRWFDAHAAALTLYARQWLGGPGAQDAVQDVFLHLATLTASPRNPKAWLFRAVRNTAVSAARSDRRRQQRENAAAAQRDEFFQRRPEDLVDATAAQEALAALPQAQREVVVLRIWGQMTLAEIAQTIQLPLSTVYDHYREALNALRRRMESPCRTSDRK